MLLEHDDPTDLNQPEEEHSSHGAKDEVLDRQRSTWGFILFVTRDDHSVGIDDDTVGSSVTAPASSVSAHGFLLDQG